MSSSEIAAIAAALILTALMCFQLLLAAGLPLGRAAWGGQHRVLSVRLRWSSLAAVGVLGLAAWVILARADLLLPGAESMAIRVATWMFAGYLSLNTLMNFISKSQLERYVMTPVAALLALCFILVALSG